MKSRALLIRLAAGNFKNVRFRDLEKLLEDVGFKLLRTSGSHHIFGHGQVKELVNIQNVKGEAKPYQIRQVLQIIEKYGLVGKDL